MTTAPRPAETPAKPDRLRPILTLVLIAALFQAIGGLLGWITAQDVNGWYQTLNRSPLNPPGYVFGIVWPVLYLLLAYAFWKVWTAPASRRRSLLLVLFSAHMLLNWAWTPLFFTLHWVLASLLVIAAMIVTAAMLGWLLRSLSSWAALVFVPYLAWLIFAGHLTQYILAHN